LARTGLE